MLAIPPTHHTLTPVVEERDSLKRLPRVRVCFYFGRQEHAAGALDSAQVPVDARL